VANGGVEESEKVHCNQVCCREGGWFAEGVLREPESSGGNGKGDWCLSGHNRSNLYVSNMLRSWISVGSKPIDIIGSCAGLSGRSE